MEGTVGVTVGDGLISSANGFSGAVGATARCLSW